MSLVRVNSPLRPRLPLWPCELCGDAAGAQGICVPCHADLPWIPAACPGCGRPGAPREPCPDCVADPPPWSRAIAPLAWRFPVDALVTRFKYHGALHFGALLGRLLRDACAGRPVDALVPVPLHASRLAERGFNQAAELARPVARGLRVPILHGAARRARATRPQASLPEDERQRNLAGAFAAGPGVSGRRLAIVDDVLTTGTTARALAEALLAAGAADVEVWVVARGGTGQAGW